MPRRGGLVYLALVLTVAGCTGDTRPEPSDGPRPLAASGEPLERGTYVTSEFSEPFAFSVGDDPW
ncbi:MAG TPA: hypothetical protein VG709_05760, partial [Actinomycetota bacterium]|nr:hypothetical protein [Actinomycetota bacterium]